MVSRETSGPPVPESARGVLAEDRIPLAQRYVDLLATEGVLRGLIGPREAPRLWERHVLNCALLQEAVPIDATVADVGSGAGLPGLALAIARPDLRVTLVEPLLRRTTFLDDVVAELGLDVEVVRARAEVLHGSRRFDVVTSRAVAPFGRLLGWCMPLVAPTGSMMALKGARARAELEQASEEIAGWPVRAPEVLELGSSGGDVTVVAVRVAWADPTSVSCLQWPSTGSRSDTSSSTTRKRRRQRG